MCIRDRHIAADAFAKAAGIEINLVPFDGAATAVTNLMGGHVQMVPVSESEVASGVASGKLKILAVCSSDRSEFNPDVPTLQELGYDAVSYTHLDVYKRQVERRAPCTPWRSGVSTGP